MHNGYMEKNIITQYFEEIETTKDYNGYFCSVAEAITIVILGSICGLKNVSQIHQRVSSDRISRFFKGEFYNTKCAVLLLAFMPVETDKTEIP